MSELIRQTWGSTPSATGQKRSVKISPNQKKAVGYFRGHPPQAGGHGNFRTDDVLSHSLASKEQRNGINKHGF